MARTILVCDDDPELRKLLALLLGGYGEILQAADGEEALRLIESRRPDLVLLDMTMPGLSGLQTLRRSRESHPEVAAVMLTGRQQLGLARRALALGARSYITKPFDPEQVKAEVDRILAPSGKKAGTDPSGRPWRVVP